MKFTQWTQLEGKGGCNHKPTREGGQIHCRAAITHMDAFLLHRKKVKQDQWVLIEGLGQLAVFFLERRCRVPTLSISTLWAEGKMAADEAMETGEGSSILDPDAQKR